jgi:hypothetical protein
MFRALTLAACAAVALASYDVYVSTKGVDTPSGGTKQLPFQCVHCTCVGVVVLPGFSTSRLSDCRTIGYAKQQIETIARDEPINVWIMGGTYFLNETIEFGPSDSGAFDAPVTYAALPGTGPVVIR